MADRDLPWVEFGYAIPFSEDARPAVEAFMRTVQKEQEEKRRKMEAAARNIWSEPVA